MAESDAAMMGERRATNHPCAAGTVLRRVAAINDVPLPIMRKLCENTFHRLFGHASSCSLVVEKKEGRGWCIFDYEH